MMSLEKEFPQYNWGKVDDFTRNKIEKVLSFSKMLSKEEQDALGRVMEESVRRKELLYD